MSRLLTSAGPNDRLEVQLKQTEDVKVSWPHLPLCVSCCLAGSWLLILYLGLPCLSWHGLKTSGIWQNDCHLHFASHSAAARSHCTRCLANLSNIRLVLTPCFRWEKETSQHFISYRCKKSAVWEPSTSVSQLFEWNSCWQEVLKTKIKHRDIQWCSRLRVSKQTAVGKVCFV